MELTFNNKYKSKKIIGKGGFGTIYKVLEIETKKLDVLINKALENAMNKADIASISISG